jgi:hypothetical protein
MMAGKGKGIGPGVEVIRSGGSHAQSSCPEMRAARTAFSKGR